MAVDVASWTITAAYNELARIEAAGNDALRKLNEQKAALTDAYSRARAAADTALMAKLNPLVHANTVLRMQAQDYKAKFNASVAALSKMLEAAGFRVPGTLAGLGIAPALVIVPAAIITGMLILWGIINALNAGRATVDKGLAGLMAVANDPGRSPAERATALAAYGKTLAELGLGAGDWMKDLVPALGLVALIVLGPTLLKMLPRGSR